MISRNMKNLIRSLIQETILLEDDGNLASQQDVVAAIDNALRPERLGITITGFRDLMIEIAIAESARGVGKHTNEMNGTYKGVFQLSDEAVKETQRDEILRKTKARLDSSRALMEPWKKQEMSSVFESIKMQALAASLYALYAYYEFANEPSLATIVDRATFWKKYYNTNEDPDSTVEHYLDSSRKYRVVK